MFIFNFIKLNNFVTSNVNDMTEIFYGCSSLISLDLSSFITSYVNSMEYHKKESIIEIISFKKLLVSPIIIIIILFFLEKNRFINLK